MVLSFSWPHLPRSCFCFHTWDKSLSINPPGPSRPPLTPAFRPEDFQSGPLNSTSTVLCSSVRQGPLREAEALQRGNRVFSAAPGPGQWCGSCLPLEASASASAPSAPLSQCRRWPPRERLAPPARVWGGGVDPYCRTKRKDTCGSSFQLGFLKGSIVYF